jgi:hypothetical protein
MILPLLVFGDAIFEATVYIDNEIDIIKEKGGKKRLPQRLKKMFRLAEYYHPDSASATNTTGREDLRSRIRISNTCPRLLGLNLYALFFGRSLLTLVAGLFIGIAKRFVIRCLLLIGSFLAVVLVFGPIHLDSDFGFLPPLGFGVGNGSFWGLFGLLVVMFLFLFFFCLRSFKINDVICLVGGNETKNES